MRRCPNEWQVLRVFFTKYRNRLFGKRKTKVQALKCTRRRAKHFVGTVLWALGLGNNGTLRFISNEEAIQRLREIHSFPSGVCKVVGLNSLVRQFGLRFYCNGVKQSAKYFLKACPACQGILPFLPCPLHHALSAPRAHLNGYRLILFVKAILNKRTILFS